MKTYFEAFRYGRKDPLLLFILTVAATAAAAQSSPAPVILDYDATSLPVTYQVNSDTTFCNTQWITIHGQDFKRATGGEVWDTTWVVFGIVAPAAVTIVTQGNGNDDRITCQVPLAANIAGNDTCLLLRLIKKTHLGLNSYYYYGSDTICLTGDRATVSYGSGSFCLGDTNPLPTISLTPPTATGGFCCASGAPGFVVQPGTGEILLHPGAVGNSQFLYVTNHPRCADTVGLAVVIQARQAAVATINGQTLATVCQGGGLVRPDSANLWPNNGVFRSPTGLYQLNPLTGLFDPALSPTGLHELWYVPQMGCYDSTLIQVLVLGTDDPAFSYPPNGNFCIGDPDPWPLIAGAGGGLFRAVTPGTVVDPDGRLRLSASGAGAHTIRHVTNGTCPDSTDLTVSVFGNASANFAYPASVFCTGDTNPFPQMFGTPGGMFTADTSLPIDSLTGEIFLSHTQPGFYNVTYTLSGSCQAQFTQTIQISPTDSATRIAYIPDHHCQSDPDPIPLVTGDTLGSFIAGGGIEFSNTDRGQLDLSAMQPGGPYIVYYDIDNRCAIDTRDSVWIDTPDDPAFSYPQASYCEGGANPLPSSIAMTGGTFSEITGSVVFSDTTTGEIDARLSLPGGPFFITYTTAGPCPEFSTSQLAILAKPYGAAMQVIPDTVYCESQEVTVSVAAGGVSGIQWFLNGSSVGDPNQATIALQAELQGHDTLTTVLENLQGCTDTLETRLTGLQSPHLAARVLSSQTNAFGSATVTYEMQTDQPNTVVDWVTDGTGIGDISPDSGSLTAFGPNSLQTLEIRANLETAFDLGVLRLTLSPHGGGCTGVVVAVMDTLSPDTQAIFVPEMFTPDGNGLNDTWMITCMKGLDPNDYKMFLFNGAGGKVLQMDGLHQHFDGGGLPDGVYWWVLEDQGGKAVNAGGLTIRRK